MNELIKDQKSKEKSYQMFYDRLVIYLANEKQEEILISDNPNTLDKIYIPRSQKDEIRDNINEGKRLENLIKQGEANGDSLRKHLDKYILDITIQAIPIFGGAYIALNHFPVFWAVAATSLVLTLKDVPSMIKKYREYNQTLEENYNNRQKLLESNSKTRNSVKQLKTAQREWQESIEAKKSIPKLNPEPLIDGTIDCHSTGGKQMRLGRMNVR